MVNKRISKKCASLFCLLLFVPLIAMAEPFTTPDQQTDVTLPELIYASSEPFSEINSANLDGLLQRIGDSRVVLLGEATHGTAEFYDMRARITQELIEKKGFKLIAVEADWPDAESIDHFIRGTGHDPFLNPELKNKPFTGFPSWMWANHSVLSFVHWLKDTNQSFHSAKNAIAAEDTMRFDNAVRFYGLDLYNMFSSIDVVLDYLQHVDPKAADVARWSYGCLMPWANDPSIYSRVMQSGRYRGCGDEVIAVLQDLRKERARYTHTSRRANHEAARQRYFNAEQNARLVTNGERYYRTMYQANSNVWNQRDQNMFDTLLAILNYHGQSSKVVVWAHNSHIGDARATDMSARGEFNLGQRVRETFGDSAYLVGFGTDHGTVAAASKWLGAMKVMQIPPAHKESYEYLCHEVKADNFLLPLRHPVPALTRKKLLAERLQRAIGTTYDPEDELKKHYLNASLPRQFDEYIWFDETRAVTPLKKLKSVVDRVKE